MIALLFDWQSGDSDLAHHAVILVLDDVTVVHERHPGRGGLSKRTRTSACSSTSTTSFQRCLMRCRVAAVLAQDPEARAMDMERVAIGIPPR